MTTPTGTDELRGDLDTRADIHDVVVEFYREIVFDDLLAAHALEPFWPEHFDRWFRLWVKAHAA